MRVQEACKNYFTPTLPRMCKGDFKTNAIALAKIFSYLTLIIPIGVGIAYGISSLYHTWLQKGYDKALPELAAQETALLKNIEEADENTEHQYIQRLCTLAVDFRQKAGDFEKAKKLIGLAKDCNQCCSNEIDLIHNFFLIADAECKVNRSGVIVTIGLIEKKLGACNQSEEVSLFYTQLVALCNRSGYKDKANTLRNELKKKAEQKEWKERFPIAPIGGVPGWLPRRT